MRCAKSSAAVLMSRDKPSEHRQLQCHHSDGTAVAKSIAAQASEAWNLFNKNAPAGSLARNVVKDKSRLAGLTRHVPSSSVLPRKPPATASPDIGTRLQTAAQRARVAIAAAEERAAFASARPGSAASVASSGNISRPSSALQRPSGAVSPAPWQPPVAQISLAEPYHCEQLYGQNFLSSSQTESLSAGTIQAEAARLDRTGPVVRQRQQQPRQQQLPQRRRMPQIEKPKAEDACSQSVLQPKSLPANDRPVDVDKSAPVLLGHPLSRKEAVAEPKCSVDFETSVPESIFEAMERLGQAARHRGQHALVKGSRGKRLMRHDCLEHGRSPSKPPAEKQRVSLPGSSDLFQAKHSWVQSC